MANLLLSDTSSPKASGFVENTRSLFSKSQKASQPSMNAFLPSPFKIAVVLHRGKEAIQRGFGLWHLLSPFLTSCNSCGFRLEQHCEHPKHSTQMLLTNEQPKKSIFGLYRIVCSSSNIRTRFTPESRAKQEKIGNDKQGRSEPLASNIIHCLPFFLRSEGQDQGS